jgi:dihydroorotate dehydrogenase (fumarate)
MAESLGDFRYIMDINLMINFGGLQLRSPLIVGSCPMTADAPTRIAMQSSGAGAIALPSLFEEQVIAWAKRNGKQLTSREQRLLSLSEANDIEQTCGDVESYLSMVRQASEESSIPIIASINGEVGGHWANVAEQLQTFGADAIEILLHHPAPGHPLHPNTIEDMVVATVSQIQQHVNWYDGLLVRR